jgi:hypothetical protein
MNNGEKAATDPFFTRNCTKQQYESGPAGLILLYMAAGSRLPIRKMKGEYAAAGEADASKI